MFKKEAKLILAILISPLILGLFAAIIGQKIIEPQPIENEKQQKLNDGLVLFFKSRSFEIGHESLINLFNKLDPKLSYTIQGYSCSNSEGSKEERLSEADKRAKIVREQLIRKGFPGIKLSTIAYGYSSECKVVLVTSE